jgi:small membrane protein
MSISILQVLIALFALFAISRSYLRFKNGNATLSEFVGWCVLWVVMAVIVFIPAITKWPARLFGIQRGIDVIVYLGIVILFYSTYRIYSKIEKVEQDITKLTRELAKRK